MAKKKKAEILAESQVEKAYELLTGCNYPDGEDGEIRLDAGTPETPTIVFEKDFPPDVWADLVEMSAVRLVVEPEPLQEDESIAAEIIE